MEIEFKDHVYDRLETDSSFASDFASAIVTMYRKRLQLIRAANDERVFYAMKSLHFEKLNGNLSGKFSMRLNDQWRLILEIKRRGKDKIIVIESITDYH